RQEQRCGVSPGKAVVSFTLFGVPAAFPLKRVVALLAEIAIQVVGPALGTVDRCPSSLTRQTQGPRKAGMDYCRYSITDSGNRAPSGPKRLRAGNAHFV